MRFELWLATVCGFFAIPEGCCVPFCTEILWRTDFSREVLQFIQILYTPPQLWRRKEQGRAVLF